MKKRFISMAMALLFVAGLPISAFAQEYNLDEGSITVTADSSGQYVTQTNGVLKEVQTSDTVIYQTPSTETGESKSTSNTVTITAEKGATAEVTLENVNIDASGTKQAAVSTNGEGDVTIELDGDNTVKSGDNHAGVEKNNDGSLTITDENNDNASLEATGGWGGAGIGGAKGDTEVSNITIDGGTVTGKGGGWSAGIGSGYVEGKQVEVSNITINGGTVTGKGATYSAGIGSGYVYKSSAKVSNITINGGTVTATSGSHAAGIGSGYALERQTEASNITINGGDVTATGGWCGAGIGGGYNGSASNVSIKDAKVYAEGGERGAGIGGGYKRKLTGTVAISGDADVTSVAPSCTRFDKNYSGAAIGDGIQWDDPNFVNGEEATLDTSKLTKNGRVKLSSVNGESTIIGTYVPPVAAKAAEQTVKLYNVVDKDGKSISYKTEVKDGVLTITVDADYAVLTGTAANISALTAQGVTTVVFVTSGATSTFDLADLSAKGSGTYKLTHDGAAVTFTLDETDISEILK